MSTSAADPGTVRPMSTQTFAMYHDEEEVKPGRLMTRYVRSLVVAKGDAVSAAAFAMGQRWMNRHDIAHALKSAVSATSTADLAAAVAPVTLDFVNFLRPRTIIGRLTLARRVPLKTRLLMQTGGASAAFTGEGAPIAVSQADFSAPTYLQPASCAGIVVISDELARMGTPDAESLLADDLGRAAGLAMDREFCTPGIAPSDSTPGSVFNGLTPVTSSGSSVAQIDADLDALVHQLVDNDTALDAAVWIMGTHTAGYLARQRSSGVPAYPDVTPLGGTLLGLPVLVSRALDSAGSPGSALIGLIDQDSILLGDQNGARIDISQEASLQMLSDPATGAQAHLPLWQNALSAVKYQRFIRWALRRSAGAAYMNVSY